MSTAVRSYLPWYRAGHAAGLTGVPAAGAGRAAVPAGVRLRGEPGRGRLDAPMVLAGPGDVLGIQPGEVLRTEPFDGCGDFEPSYFPYVELKNPDLPWRFTPQGTRSADLAHQGDAAVLQQQRVQPWIALAVVPAETATLSQAEQGGTATLHCPAAELPDPTEAWAWAHVQVTHEAMQPVTAETVRAGVARLLCPRRLEGGVHYLACVVPTFATGAAALTGAEAAEPLAPAWGPDGEVDLPAYVSWSFTTGQGGSFESLVRRLRPRPIPASAGGRPIATGAPGWGAHAGAPDATAAMQGALRPIDVTEPALGDDTLAASLRSAVSRSGTGVELRPPIYGQDYAHGVTALPEANAGAGWLDQLNTDPRRRAAAGLAAWSVVINQEELVDAAWKQLLHADVPRPGDPDPALADAVTGSLGDRHGIVVQPEGAVRLVDAAQPESSVEPWLAGGALPTIARLLRGAGPAARGAVPSLVAHPVALAETATTPTGFAPMYDQPGYQLLRSVAPQWLFPSVGDLPADTVAVARTNPAFVESFMVGLNHAIARELQWRRFPLRADGTFVDSFWGGEADRLPPIAGWAAEDDLGSHTGGGDQLLLVLRGVLLRRFPLTQVYLWRVVAGAEQVLQPVFSGRIGSDTTFLGFPISGDDALDTAHGGAAAWSVVVEESVDHARFGVDDPPESGPDGGVADLPSWQDLDWSHLHLAGHTYVPVAGSLAGLELPAARGSADRAVWALDAANLAVAVQQPAFRIRIPLALWLTPPPQGPPS
jgi:hypothetical protein